MENLRRDYVYESTHKKTILIAINQIWSSNNLDKYFTKQIDLSDDQETINQIIKYNSINYYINSGKFETDNVYEHWNKRLWSIAVKKGNNVAVLVNFGKIKEQIYRYKREKWDHSYLTEAYSIYEKIKNHEGILITKNNLTTNIVVIDTTNNTVTSDLYSMEYKMGWLEVQIYNQFEKDILNKFLSVTKHRKLFVKFWDDYFKGNINLNVMDIEDFLDSWDNSLTKVGKEFLKEIKKHFVNTYLNKVENSFIDEIIESCYINKTTQGDPRGYFSKLVSSKMRQSENDVREILGISKIGEGNVSETKLYYEIKTKLPQYEVIHQGNPKWLGRQRLDIYIPELDVAIEYQGGQHFDENHYFNSHAPDSFQKNKERDERKKLKCDDNGCKLIYVYEGVKYDINQIISEILNKESTIKSFGS